MSKFLRRAAAMSDSGGPRRRLAVVLRHVAAAGNGAEPAEELGDPSAVDVPIFVLQPELPAAESAFCIYEPRYRLLLQRCLEQEGPAGRRGEFGMCWPVAPGAFSDVGTLLRVTSHVELPDGRSDIRCVGVRRFRVLARGLAGGWESSTQQHAEYPTAQIEWLEDDDAEAPVSLQAAGPEAEGEEAEEGPRAGLRLQLVQFHDGLLRRYPSALAKMLLLKIHGPVTYGRLAESLDAGESVRAVIDAPADDADFIWWCLGLVLSITPLPLNLKAAVVSSRSVAERQTLASDVLGRVQTMLAEGTDSTETDDED